MYIYTRPNYSRSCIDRAKTACLNAILCVFLRGFRPNSPSGNRETTCFYEDSRHLVRQSYVFYRTVCGPFFQRRVFLRGFEAPGAPIPRVLPYFLHAGPGRGRRGGVGLPWGCPKGPGGRIAGTRGKTRGIRCPRAPNRVKNACGWVTLRRAVGRNFSPTAPGASPPDPRNTDPRGLRRFLPNLIGSVLGNAHGAVG